MGWDYQENLAKHASQTDGAKGFGGKYGVQENKDKVTYNYSEGCCDTTPTHGYQGNLQRENDCCRYCFLHKTINNLDIFIRGLELEIWVCRVGQIEKYPIHKNS